MSDEILWLGEIISTLAAMAALWSAIRRRQLMRRILRSLTDEQRRAIGLDPPPDPKP